MKISWTFDIGTTHKFSTKSVILNTVNYEARILPASFGGIPMRWSMRNNSLISPSDMDFEIDNTDASYMRADFTDEYCLVKLWIDETLSRQWKFKIERVVPAYGSLKIYCVDILQEKLIGEYPKTQHPREKWPLATPDEEKEETFDNYRIPIIFGTAYIPTMFVSIDETNYYYVLGPGSATDYTVHEVRAPSDRNGLVWNDNYDFNTFTVDNNALAQFIIAPLDVDGEVDSELEDESGTYQSDLTYTAGVWDSGAKPFVKYTYATNSSTNPADILEYVLEDFGVDSANIDTAGTWTTAKTSFIPGSENKGIVWNGGIYESQDREGLINNFLTQCHSFFYISDKIELHPFSKTSVETFDKTKIKKLSFRPSKSTKRYNDSGHVHWAVTDLPQHKLDGKKLLPITGETTDNPDSETLQLSFIQDSDTAQRIGKLYFEQKLTGIENISFETSGAVITTATLNNIKPGQVITMDDAIFGGEKLVIINNIHIKPDLTISISGETYEYLHEYHELYYDTINVPLYITNPSFGAGAKDGAAGINGRTVSLLSTKQAFIYNTDGLSPDPANTTITATAFNLDTTKTINYEFFLNDISVQNTESNTYNYTPKENYSNMPDKIEVQVIESEGLEGTIVARDQIVLYGLLSVTSGAAAQHVVITSEQVFKYESGNNIPDPESITLTAQLFGGLTEYDWKYWDISGGAWTSFPTDNGSSALTLTHNSSVWDERKFIRVRCYSGDSYDETKILKVYDGSNALSGTFTNPHHNAPADSDGSNVDLSGAGGEPLIYWEDEEVTDQFTFNVLFGSTKNGLTFNINSSTGAYYLSEEAGGWISNTESFLVNASSETMPGSISFVYSITKAKQGYPGANAQYVSMASEQFFKYESNSGIPDPTSITITAQLFGGLTEYDWKYWDISGGAWTSFPTGNGSDTFTFTHNDSLWDGHNFIRIRCYSGDSYDQIKLVKVYDGSDAVSGVLTNSNHSAPADSDGSNVDLSEAGGEIIVYHEGEDVTDQFTFEVKFGDTKNGLILNVDFSTGVYYLSEEPGGWTSDTEHFLISLRSDTISSPYALVYSISKAKQGTAGDGGLTISVANSSHTVPTTNNGVVTDYSGSGTTIKVWEGASPLTYSSSGNGTFTISSTTVSPAGSITVGDPLTGTGTSICTIPDHSGMSSDNNTVKITYNISITRLNGEVVTESKEQTITKSKAGSDGSPGQDVTIQYSPDGTEGSWSNTASEADAFIRTGTSIDGGETWEWGNAVRVKLADAGNWSSDIIFSSLDENTISWSSGTINTLDVDYNIVAGDTGNMSALTYIYFDPTTSETQLQTSTDASSAVGVNKILMAAAKNVSLPETQATFQAFGGAGGALFTADNIAANTITGNKIAGNTIDASKIKVGEIVIGNLNGASSFTSYDTSYVNGTAASTVKSRADIGYGVYSGTYNAYDTARVNGTAASTVKSRADIGYGVYSGSYNAYNTNRVNGTAASTVVSNASTGASHASTTHAPSNADQTYTAINGGIISTGSIRNSANTMNINFGSATITINSSNGLIIDGSGSVKLKTGTTEQGNLYSDNSGYIFLNSEYDLYLGSNTASSYAIQVLTQSLIPALDNYTSLGASGRKYTEVWANDGTINTSDKKEKSLIEPSDLGLDFVKELQPRKWIWNNRTRPHYGLVAQDVEATIQKGGHDFAGLIKTNHTKVKRTKIELTLEKTKSKSPPKEEIIVHTNKVKPDDEIIESFDSYGLRYHEFIGPIIKAIQEIDNKFDLLSTRVSALETPLTGEVAK